MEQQFNGDRNKSLSIKGFLEEIRPYLKDIINDIKKADTWKNQLTIALVLFLRKTMMKSNAFKEWEFMIYYNTGKVIEEHFESILNRHQVSLDTSMILSFIAFIYCIKNAIK